MEEEARLDMLERKLTSLEDKLDKILELLNKDVKPSTTKMTAHIDFVEAVYENVKNPLGFLCNRIGLLAGKSIDNYPLQGAESTKLCDKTN
tara:strand:+ start:380 stop:652 length:273 start_codon:yes stop_codon:yes gene_type:complete